jgi:hypothetical protein
MYRRLRYAVVVLASILVVVPVILCGVPQIIHFQGVLEDNQGTPLDGVYSVTFSIYDQEFGGGALWSEMRDVSCEAGLFSVLLGQNTPVSLAFDAEYWLECQVSGDPAMTPRYPLSSVPYAFWSATSDSSLSAGWAQLADSADGVRWSNIDGVPPDIADGDDVGGAGDGHSLDASDGSPVDAVYVDADGDVGVGTTTPGSELHVAGDIETDTEYLIGGSRVLSIQGTGSTLVGVGAGRNNSGENATMIGYNAGHQNSGFQNTFVGYEAGTDTTTGNFNTFVGAVAGRHNRDGTQNTYVGAQTGRYVRGGSDNSFFGQYAGHEMTSGNRNTVLGSEAGQDKMYGDDNTFVGYQAGYGNAIGSGNVFIGRGAGHYETGSNKLYIENSETSFPLIYGNFETDVLGINGRLGVGTSTPAEEFHVQGEGRIDGILQVSGFRMPTGASSGYVLTSDSSGVASWSAGGGGTDADWTISGNNMYSAVSGNVGIGTTNPSAKLNVHGAFTVGQDTSNYDVNFYGDDPGARFLWDADLHALRAGRDTDGSYWAADSTGRNSIAFGRNTKAVSANATALGASSTARGWAALAGGWGSEANGDYSVALGDYTKATGDGCVALGYFSEAGGSASLAAGNQTKTGSNGCTALGRQTEASGWASSAIGYLGKASGEQAVAIGSYIEAADTSSIVIGSGVDYLTLLTNNTPNSLVVGFNSTTPTFFIGPSSGFGTTGRVGIGTTTPSEKLDVAGTAKVDTFKMPTNAANGYVLTTDATGTGTWQPQHVVDWHDEGASITIGTSATQYDDSAVTLTVPSPGHIRVTSTVRVLISHTNGTDDELRISHSDSPTAMGSSYNTFVDVVPAHYPTMSSIQRTQSIHSIHQVAAGTHTYYLVGLMNSGQDANDRFWYAHMNAVFYPDPSAVKLSNDKTNEAEMEKG